MNHLLKFKPQRFYASGAPVRTQRNDLVLHQSSKWGKKQPVVVLPADPESIQSLMDRLAEAFNGSYDGHLAKDDLQAMMRTLGFKIKPAKRIQKKA